MKKAYKIALFAALILLSLPSHAQYFDWVKSYSGQDRSSGGYNNIPTGIVNDSEGNIYYLGDFGMGAGIDTTHFLPIAPSGPGINTSGTVIAKFSPAGEMLWHKTVYSNNGQNTISCQIQMLGDTAIACLMQLKQPNGYGLYTYFLDTLLRDYDGYFVDNDSVMRGTLGALLTFNLDGELIERHMMQTAYFDTTGNLLKPYGEIQTMPLGAHHFCIDNEGNIILLRTAQDYAPGYGSLTDGAVTGLRFIIDGHKYFDFYPQGRPQGWEHQILKFSPHFDSMIFAKYFIQPEPEQTARTLHRVVFSSLKNDINGNLYISGTIFDAETDVLLSEDSSHAIRCQGMDHHGFLVKYRRDGSVAFVKQLAYSDNPDLPYDAFRGIDVDLADSCVVVPFTAGEGNAEILIDDTPLQFTAAVGFLRFDVNNGNYLSHGIVTASGLCDLPSDEVMPQVAVHNRRIALQPNYRGELLAGDSVLSQSAANYGGWGNGILIWNYDGGVLNYADYHTFSPENRMGSLVFHDSSLYAMGMLNAGATFGTNNVSYSGNSIAYLARYVDTAFLTPYRSDNDTNDNDTNDISIVSIDDDSYILIYPNPVQTELHISNIQEPVTSAFITSVNGYRKQVPVKDNAIDFRTFAPGVYFLEIVTMDNKVYSAKIIKR